MKYPSRHPCADQTVSDNQSKKNRIGHLEKVWNYKGKGFQMLPDPVANGQVLKAFGIDRKKSVQHVLTVAHKHISIARNHWISGPDIHKYCEAYSERTVRRDLKICVEAGLAVKRKNGRQWEYYFIGLYHYLRTGQVLSIEHLSQLDSKEAFKDSGQNDSGQNDRKSGQNDRNDSGQNDHKVQCKYSILLDKQDPVLLSIYKYKIGPRSMDSVVFNTTSTTNTEKKSAPSPTPSPALKTALKTPRTNKADTPDTEKKSAPSPTPSLKPASKTPKTNKADSSKRVKMFRELNSNPESKRLLASINASDADLRALISDAIKADQGTKAIIKALEKSISIKARNPIAYTRAILRNPPRGLTKTEETSQYNYLKAQSKEAALAAQEQKQRREDIKAIEDKLKASPYNKARSIAKRIGVKVSLLASWLLGKELPPPDGLKRRLLDAEQNSKSRGGSFFEFTLAFHGVGCAATA